MLSNVDLILVLAVALFQKKSHVHVNCPLMHLITSVTSTDIPVQ